MNNYIFYSKATGGFYDPEFNKTMPSDVVKLTREQHLELRNKESQGMSIVANEQGYPVATNSLPDYIKIQSERLWRNLELNRSDIELNKVQDSDPKATGSVSDWRNYRKALRAWPEQEQFPNKEFRPGSPDA